MWSSPIIAGEFAYCVGELPSHPIQPLITCGPVRLHKGQRRAWLGERELPLNGKEFAILTELAKRGGNVATVAELAAQSHDYTDLHDPGALVRPVISSLRRKMALTEGQPGYIANVPGGWYRLEL